VKCKNTTLSKKSFLTIVCLFGILLLQFSIVLVYSPADHDWKVRLRQSPGTFACVEGGWTKHGEPIAHPGGFYTLCCDGTEKEKVIPKEDLATEPNDADYDIRIWWPGTPHSDPPDVNLPGERIDAPGSKKYTHESPSYEVVFEVSPTLAVGGVSIPVDKFGLLAPHIGMASMILVATAATAIYVKRKKEKQ
jgi:hypothetical protein